MTTKTAKRRAAAERAKSFDLRNRGQHNRDKLVMKDIGSPSNPTGNGRVITDDPHHHRRARDHARPVPRTIDREARRVIGVIHCAICPGGKSRFWTSLNEVRPSTPCNQCHQMLLRHAIVQEEWMPCKTALPPMSGYYLATWMGGAKVTRGDIGGYSSEPNAIVTELWFNPDSVGPWWIADHSHRTTHLDSPLSRRIEPNIVLAWQTMPPRWEPK